MYNFTTEANCNGLDTELFFTDKKLYENVETLKRVCNNCIVKAECLDYALHHAVLGWWGGTSEKTRRSMQQKLNISPEPVLISEKWVAQMIYDIAVGAFIALALYDLVAHIAKDIAYRVNARQRVKKLQEMFEDWEEYTFEQPKTRKKAAPKKLNKRK